MQMREDALLRSRPRQCKRFEAHWEPWELICGDGGRKERVLWLSSLPQIGGG